MSAKEFVVVVHVGAAGSRGFAATSEISGNPLCLYGQDAAEAERKVKGAALRLLGSLVERGLADLGALKFKTTNV